MRIALLSAGPSLAKSYDASQPYDLVIGVNTAASLFECDWWSVGDAHRFFEITPKGNPKVFTIGAERDKVLASDDRLRLQGVEIEEWQTVMDHAAIPAGMPNFSCTAALMFCHYLKADSVDAYGVDMIGAEDVTGEATRWREPVRWGKERVEWAYLVNWMQESGITVERIAA